MHFQIPESLVFKNPAVLSMEEANNARDVSFRFILVVGVSRYCKQGVRADFIRSRSLFFFFFFLSRAVEVGIPSRILRAKREAPITKRAIVSKSGTRFTTHSTTSYLLAIT